MRPAFRILPAALLFVFFTVAALPAADTDTRPAEEGPFLEHEDLFHLYQPYLSNINGYKPVYFLFATRPQDTKFQFSLKYRLINPKSRLVEKLPFIDGFHIAYTQTSFWDLGGDSKPFDDTSYKPEFFFLSSNFFSGRGSSHLFFQTGYEHESNGQAGDTSRSTNYLYIKPMYVFFHKKSSLGFQLAPKIWTYVANTDRTNPDINEYRGYFDLQFKFGRTDLAVLDTHWRWAKKGHSIRMDLTYPLDHLIKANPQLYLHAQYVNALSESLLDYTERKEAFRIGISIVR